LEKKKDTVRIIDSTFLPNILWIWIQTLFSPTKCIQSKDIGLD